MHDYQLQMVILNLESSDGTVTTDLTHVVFTRDAAGNAYIYVDNNQEATVNTGGNLSVWNATR